MRTYIPKNYGISKDRYLELRAFCLQYDEYNQAKYTQLKAQAEQKIARIEETALQAVDNSEPLFRCLMENVTHEKAFNNMECPCSRGTFYKLRKRFFALLDLNEA